MDQIITRLGPGDVTRANTNCSLFWNMDHSIGHLSEFLDDPNNILAIAEIRGEPVGQIIGYILKRWDSKKPMLFLYSIDVIEPQRRKGIARLLMKYFLQIGTESGCASSFVFTNKSNTAAMEMYRALGGTRTNPDDVMFEWEELHEPIT